MDQSGSCYVQNQMVDEAALKVQLINIVAHAAEPLTLIIQADKNVRQADIIRLALLARDAGITESLLATLPRAVAAPVRP